MKEIPLTQGKVALVDDEDYERVIQNSWCTNKIGNGFYAKRGKSTGETIYLHRFILNVEDRNVIVDHKNGDGLDCQKHNLRICNKSQNATNSTMHKDNTSGYKGVTFDKNRNKWTAQIYYNGKHLVVGRFESAIAAARAYDQIAIKYHGEFANTNFPRKADFDV